MIDDMRDLPWWLWIPAIFILSAAVFYAMALRQVNSDDPPEPDTER